MLDSDLKRNRPVVKIQEGCDEFCTYCVVAYARGKPRSRDHKRIIFEVTKLAEAGYKEIVLAGTHMGTYGNDLDDIGLHGLLKELVKLDYPIRFRLSSIEPMVKIKELINVMAESEKICNNLYLPIQSGSDDILKRMGRRYTVSDIVSTVEQARGLMSDISIVSDIIVGFPGEQQSDHLKTMEAVKQLKLSKLHVFPYSPRNNTPAARFSDQVRPDIKKQRAEEMSSLGKFISNNFNQRFLGKKLSVLIERIVNEDVKWGEGFSENYILARFAINELSVNVGDLVTVVPQQAFAWGVKGTII